MRGKELTQAIRKWPLRQFKRKGLRRFRMAYHPVTRFIFTVSIFISAFALILSTGNFVAASNPCTSNRYLNCTAFIVADEIPMNISILSPQNITYTVSEIPLTFTVNAPFSIPRYSLDREANITMTGNLTLTNLMQGTHSIIVYANDAVGTAASQIVYFTIGQVSIFEMVPLGIIQGLTEWLPVSSTAHLKIVQYLLNLEATPLLDVTLHLGTLIVVVFYFRRDVKELLAALVHLDFKSDYGRLIPLIVIGTIPTAIIGVLYAEFLGSTFQSLLIIGITFVIGATYLYTSRIGKENIDTIPVSVALIMGFAQGLASFPGLSRSGVTISTALLLGLRRDKAFKFSFLLSIPAIVGDVAFEAYHSRGQLAVQYIGPLELLAGIALAALAGYVAIKLVSNLVRSKRFHYFAIYTWTLGLVLIGLTLSGFLAI